MNKRLLVFTLFGILLYFNSCSFNKESEVLTQEESKEVESLLKSDQEKLDSMKRVLQEKYKD